jgi:hypothetical protein
LNTPRHHSRIKLWLQVLTGEELGADEKTRKLDAPTWHERRKRLESLGGPPDLPE